jgi:hypothetical protein
MLRSRLPSLIIAVLLVAAVAGIVYAFSSSRRPPEQKTSAVRQVMPPAGDLDLRQVQVGVTLNAGYTGDLFVDGAQVPEDEVHREPALYQITLAPKPEGQFSLGPGRHCASVRYWPLANASDKRDAPPWCFNLH